MKTLTGSENLISKEYWEGVIRCKKNFLYKGEDPRKNCLVRKEVAESWIRSKKHGVDTRTRVVNLTLLKSELKKIRDDNRLLIEAATPADRSFYGIDNFLRIYAGLV